MARGDRRPRRATGEGRDVELTEAEKARVNAVIAQAEKDTGLEFCLVYGSRPESVAREEAERAFSKLGLHQRPGVMIQVVPHARTLEVVTSSEVQGRVTDQDADEAVRLMTGIFATGDIVGGLERGFQFLADQAGGDKDPQTRDRADLPNVVDLDETPPD